MSNWENTFKSPIDYLLQENGDFILLEQDPDGATNTDYIVLNQSGQTASLWNNETKH